MGKAGRPPIYDDGAMLQVKIFTPRELKQELQAVADDQGVSLSEMIRRSMAMMVQYAKMQRAQATKPGASPSL